MIRRPQRPTRTCTLCPYTTLFRSETSAQYVTAAFVAKLRTHAGYAQLQAEVVAGVNVNAGVRYETAKQTVLPIDLFDSGASAIVPTHLDRDYWLPAVTGTWEMAPDLPLRSEERRVGTECGSTCTSRGVAKN